MKKYRYINTECFKVGERVWVTGVGLYPSGRIKYLVEPITCEIVYVDSGKITINKSGLNYYLPSNYYLDHPERTISPTMSINFNIAKTKKEAIENFNSRLIYELEEKFSSFKQFEWLIKSKLL